MNTTPPPLPPASAKPKKKQAGPVAILLAIGFLVLVIATGVNSIEQGNSSNRATAAVAKPSAPPGPPTPAMKADRIKALSDRIYKVEYNDLRTPHLMEVTFKPSEAFTDRQVYTGFAVASWEVLKRASAEKLVPAGAGMSFTLRVTMVDQYGGSETNNMMTIELAPEVLDRINWESGHFSQYNLLNVSHLAFLRHDIDRQTLAFCAGKDADDVAPFCRQVVAYIDK